MLVKNNNYNFVSKKQLTRSNKKPSTSSSSLSNSINSIIPKDTRRKVVKGGFRFGYYAKMIPIFVIPASITFTYFTLFNRDNLLHNYLHQSGSIDSDKLDYKTALTLKNKLSSLVGDLYEDPKSKKIIDSLDMDFMENLLLSGSSLHRNKELKNDSLLSFAFKSNNPDFKSQNLSTYLKTQPQDEYICKFNLDGIVNLRQLFNSVDFNNPNDLSSLDSKVNKLLSTKDNGKYLYIDIQSPQGSSVDSSNYGILINSLSKDLHKQFNLSAKLCNKVMDFEINSDTSLSDILTSESLDDSNNAEMAGNIIKIISNS